MSSLREIGLEIKRLLSAPHRAICKDADCVTVPPDDYRKLLAFWREKKAKLPMQLDGLRVYSSPDCQKIKLGRDEPRDNGRTAKEGVRVSERHGREIRKTRRGMNPVTGK